METTVGRPRTHVEGLAAVLGGDCLHHRGHVALEVAAVLLAQLLHADDADTGHWGRRAAAIDPAAELVAAVLAEHRHVMPGGHQLAQ